MDEVEVVVAHRERATLRVGQVFLKIDADQNRMDREVDSMTLACVPTAEVLWRQPPVLALAALPGAPLGRLGEPSRSSPAAWMAAGAAVRRLHDSPLPPRSGRSVDEFRVQLDEACDWFASGDLVSHEVVIRSRAAAERALRPWEPVFMHGDLQVDHVFIEGDAVTGILDWSEASQGDPLYDLAILTIGHPEHLDDVIAGYGSDVDVEVVRAWWLMKSLLAIRWLIDHGFDPTPELEVLRTRS